MHPILGRFGPFLFYSYTFFLSAGLLIAVGLAAWESHRGSGLPFSRWTDAIMVSLAAAVAGGRIVYVASHSAYFQMHPNEVWLLTRGGFSYHGALLTGLAGMALWCRWRDFSFAHVAGLLTPGAALWHAFGCLACLFEGCAFGRETFLGPLAADLPDSFGLYAVRYQTQLLGFFLSLLAFAILWRLRRELRPGALFLLGLALISGGRFAVDLLRGDPMPIVGNVRLDVLIDGTLAAAATLGLLVYTNRFRAGSSPESRTVLTFAKEDTINEP